MGGDDLKHNESINEVLSAQGKPVDDNKPLSEKAPDVSKSMDISASQIEQIKKQMAEINQSEIEAKNMEIA